MVNALISIQYCSRVVLISQLKLLDVRSIVWLKFNLDLFTFKLLYVQSNRYVQYDEHEIPYLQFYFILILIFILWTRLGKRELLDRAIYFNLNIVIDL